MRTWVWRSWVGKRRAVDAQSVEFAPAHIVFMDDNGAVILAVDNADVHDLHPEDEGDPVWWES